MTKISAQVIADSKNEFGNRITTMVVTFPRFILAELNTHRMLSKNSASSRAIPFEKMVKAVEENPFIPIAWQKDHKGMQGTEYFTHPMDIQTCINNWNTAKAKAKSSAISMAEHGVTKQLCNRLLEPFMWHTVIITGTEWENFFALRCPQYEIAGTTFRSKKEAIKQFPLCEDGTAIDWLQRNKGQAEIHMMALAEAMWDAMNESIPKKLKAGEWHIPFGNNIDKQKLYDMPTTSNIEGNTIDNLKIKIATARCARVSYTVVGEEGKPDNYEADIALHDRLAKMGHWSPFEHCAKSMTHNETISVNNKIFITGDTGYNNELGWSGNFRGFIQYRKTFNNENITK